MREGKRQCTIYGGRLRRTRVEVNAKSKNYYRAELNPSPRYRIIMQHYIAHTNCTNTTIPTISKYDHMMCYHSVPNCEGFDNGTAHTTHGKRSDSRGRELTHEAVSETTSLTWAQIRNLNVIF
jgi:hypothetical protein